MGKNIILFCNLKVDWLEDASVTVNPGGQLLSSFWMQKFVVTFQNIISILISHFRQTSLQLIKKIPPQTNQTKNIVSDSNNPPLEKQPDF